MQSVIKKVKSKSQTYWKKWSVSFKNETESFAPGLRPSHLETTDTDNQVVLFFRAMADAILFCNKHKIPYKVIDTVAVENEKPKSYERNFSHDRPTPWTH